MKIALRCQKCRIIWMQGEEDLCLEIDFYDNKISFVCPQCKKENILDLKAWKNEQKSSKLPSIRVI